MDATKFSSHLTQQFHINVAKSWI